MLITVVPLDLPQLRSLEVDPSRLGGIPVAMGALPPLFILEAAIGALQQGRSPIWFSPFVFVEKRLDQIVGTGGFKGSPVDRRVEIGYGVAEQHRGRGFATAAVRALLQVAFSDPGVAEVYAETAAFNMPSRRVVEKVGFRHLGQRVTEGDGVVDRWLTSAPGTR